MGTAFTTGDIICPRCRFSFSVLDVPGFEAAAGRVCHIPGRLFTTVGRLLFSRRRGRLNCAEMKGGDA